MPTAITSSTIAILIATITVVTRDDSLIPRISTPVITATMNIAGWLTVAVSPAIHPHEKKPRGVWPGGAPPGNRGGGGVAGAPGRGVGAAAPPGAPRGGP